MSHTGPSKTDISFRVPFILGQTKGTRLTNPDCLTALEQIGLFKYFGLTVFWLKRDKLSAEQQTVR